MRKHVNVRWFTCLLILQVYWEKKGGKRKNPLCNPVLMKYRTILRLIKWVTANWLSMTTGVHCCLRTEGSKQPVGSNWICSFTKMWYFHHLLVLLLRLPSDPLVSPVHTAFIKPCTIQLASDTTHIKPSDAACYKINLKGWNTAPFLSPSIFIFHIWFSLGYSQGGL